MHHGRETEWVVMRVDLEQRGPARPRDRRRRARQTSEPVSVHLTRASPFDPDAEPEVIFLEVSRLGHRQQTRTYPTRTSTPR
jgi:hypothetical protein